MTEVKVSFQQELISKIMISNHANSDEYGHDLVCAGISSISVGALNALEEVCNGTCECSMKAGQVVINVIDYCCVKTQTILQTVYIQLLTMEKSYSKFIKITKVEV